MTELSESHRNAVWLFLAGLSNKEVSEATGMTVGQITTMKSSPLFQALLTEKRKELDRRSAVDLSSKLSAQASASIDTIIHLRDNAIDDKVKLQAASALLDRVVPKKVQQSSESLKIVLDASQLGYLRAVASEVGSTLAESD